MTSIDLDQYDGLGLAELVRGKEISASELLDAVIARAETTHPKINAIVTRMYDEARAAIAAGLPSGPFTGVPYLLKDLGAHYTGVPTNGGSAMFDGFVPDHDAEITARYRRAGLVIFGKTNTPELGLAPSTEPRRFGATRNPWNLDHTAGGSSGGAAAAVAAGVVPMAHATDGGGSIRIPASCCGLVGLKTTRGRNPLGPDAGEGWGGASVGHAVTRTVRDSAALLDATSGADVGDPYWAPPPARPFLDEVGRAPGTLRIALTTTSFNNHPVDPECADAARAIAKQCAALGHTVDEAKPEFDVTELGMATRIVVASNIRNVLELRARALGRELKESDVERMTWLRVVDAGKFSAVDYARSIAVLHKTGRAVARFMTTYDVILSPTMCRPPQTLGVMSMSTTDDAAYLDAILACIGFTSLFNQTGAPAISLPLAWSNAGLPIGIQFAGRFGDEATLLRLAAQFEAAHPWADRRPPVPA
jgi:amidase/6-aminohexanoate-cyclic-dimer hydrolase